MNSNRTSSAVFGYFSLFGSLGTLLCCALPSLLVLAGLGTTVASLLSALPWLVTLSHHKFLTFSASGLLISASFFNTYWLVPRLRLRACSPENPASCASASRLSRIILWLAAALYAAGFFAAFLLGPILARLDR